MKRSVLLPFWPPVGQPLLPEGSEEDPISQDGNLCLSRTKLVTSLSYGTLWMVNRLFLFIFKPYREGLAARLPGFVKKYLHDYQSSVAIYFQSV